MYARTDHDEHVVCIPILHIHMRVCVIIINTYAYTYIYSIILYYIIFYYSVVYYIKSYYIILYYIYMCVCVWVVTSPAHQSIDRCVCVYAYGCVCDAYARRGDLHNLCPYAIRYN